MRFKKKNRKLMNLLLKVFVTADCKITTIDFFKVVASNIASFNFSAKTSHKIQLILFFLEHREKK
jgi:hypothetical protein